MLVGEHKRYKATAEFSAIYEMGEHVNRALASPGSTITPVDFVQNLRVLSETFIKVGLEHDLRTRTCQTTSPHHQHLIFVFSSH